ncbi:unnamed protein product [Moneuplotes crassus]|uniref:RING-type domain-containing protein n=1 Tax=Euplotes crassus TaxID=5936 RepID=A0AAD1U973_EUPCR|nr:unnamed protein product [Moneuplotes crassus]
MERRDSVKKWKQEEVKGISKGPIKVKIKTDCLENRKEGSTKPEEDKEGERCPICITDFSHNDSQIIALLKSLVNKKNLELIPVSLRGKGLTDNVGEPAIFYVENSDAGKSSITESPQVALPSMQPEYNVRVVKQSDFGNKMQSLLSEFSINGVCILKACSHIYHKCCIRDWMRCHNTCPLCKRIVYKELSLSYLSSDSDFSSTSSITEPYNSFPSYPFIPEDLVLRSPAAGPQGIMNHLESSVYEICLSHEEELYEVNFSEEQFYNESFIEEEPVEEESSEIESVEEVLIEEILTEENISLELVEHNFVFDTKSPGIPLEGNQFLNVSQGNIPEKMLLDDEFSVDPASDPGHTD